MRLAACLLAFLSSVVPLAAALAAAQEKLIETKSVVTTVIVHPDAATITREATVDLPAGASVVLFKGVPFSLIPDSLRVGGQAQGALKIGSVEARAAPAEAKAPDNPVAARLKELRAERANVQVTLDALRAKLDMIVAYSKSSPGAGDAKSPSVGVGDWGRAFDAIGAAHAKTGEEIRLAKTKADEIDKEIAGLRGGAEARGGEGLTRDVAVALEAASGGPAKLTLTYQTGSANWRPAYDARLDTGGKEMGPALTLSRRAIVAQRTGEDWAGAALSVSTIGARRGAAAPQVDPQRVAFFEPMVGVDMPMARGRAAMSAKPQALGAAQAPAAPPAATDEFAAEKKEVRAQDATATLEASAYAATFKIPGPANVPGDGAPKNFTLSERKLEPKLTILSSPGLDPTAYLEARIQNEDDAPLLPGELSVVRDGLFVGVSRLPLVPPGDSTNFGFGVDDKVKVTRVPVKRKENEPTWFNQTKTDTREFKISVKNLHDFPIHATLVDQVPFSENTAIIVETLPAPRTTPPTEKQPDDRRGVMAWSFDLAPGEQRDIALAYRLKYPADREVIYQSAPTGR